MCYQISGMEKCFHDFVASTMYAGHRISLTTNADGTPLFKSSGTLIWPVQILVNELPAAQRIDKRVRSALWFEKKTADGAVPTWICRVDESLNHEWNHARTWRGRKLFKAFCICCVADSVARAPMQGLTQFNGFNGCDWCLQLGESSARALRYLALEDEPPERSEEQMVSHMEIALEQGAGKWRQNCFATYCSNFI